MKAVEVLLAEGVPEERIIFVNLVRISRILSLRHDMVLIRKAVDLIT